MGNTIMLLKSVGNSRPKTEHYLALAFLVGLSLPICHAMATSTLPALPEAVSNQLVLQTTVRGKWYLASFAGMSTQAGEDHNKAWQLTQGSPIWQPVPAVPNQARQSGRFAAAGVVMSNQFYIFAGADQAQNGSEKILSDSYRFSPLTQTYTKLPEMPVAVADSLALAYQNRYIYLISGRQQEGNVNLVQVFDNFSQKWSQATPYPGAAVAGHAGAVAGHQMLVCDGISQDFQQQAQGQIVPTAACYLGELDPKQSNKIRWQKIKHHGGPARFRQAAIGIKLNDEAAVAFIGGRDQSSSSTASNQIYIYALKQQRWLRAAITTPVQDIRSLVELDGEIYSVGGIDANNNVSSAPIKHQIKLLPE